MVDPIRPAGDSPDDGAGGPDRARRADEPDSPAAEQPAARRAEPADAERTAVLPAEEHALPADETGGSTPAPAPATAVHPRAGEPAPAAASEQQADLAPVVAPPPKMRGNRLVATAWVLLAAGLFQVVFFGVNALVALVFGGVGAIVPQIQSIAATSLAWLPVLLFFLLFELTALLFNRAGRVAYVLASLVVGAVVYVLTVLLFSLIVRGAVGDANTLAQTFLNWEFILIGLVAREVMLWTGRAIGSRGIRVRRRNREARRQYEELADG